MSASTQALAGQAVVCPGQPVGRNLDLQRPAWVQTLTQGRPAADVPGLLAAVFNLCGQSHRLCSQLALATAGALPPPDTAALTQALRRETASEHLRRIAMDWPRLLEPRGDHADGDVHDTRDGCTEGLVRQLATSPILACTPLLGPADWQAQCAWLEAHALGLPARTWWHAWTLDPTGWLQHWTQHTPGWLPRLLARAARPTEGWTLRVDQPHTGCWSRQADGPVRPLTDWALLGARIADLVALCLDDGSPTTGPRRLRWGTHAETGAEPVAVAWVEMARGLLVHRASITPASGTEPARVRRYQVHAPTDLNLAPQGEVAHALAACRRPGTGSLALQQVRRLMAAFDPCVPFRVESHISKVAHA